MSTDLVHVPDAARDLALTPTQRFEMIVRTQIPNYEAPRESGAKQLTPQQAFKESAQYVERSKDSDGLISYHSYPKALACGYSLPAMPLGMKVAPEEVYKNLSVFRSVGLSQDLVHQLVLEYARQWT